MSCEGASFVLALLTVSSYRLACVQTLFMDIQYASRENVDAVLWQTHAFLNDRYRKALAKLKSPQQIVLRRKVERQYGNFLKLSQYFYRGYVQRLWARYGIPQLEHIARSLELEAMSVKPEEHVDAVATGVDRLVLRSCHLTLIYLGDLCRYRSHTRQKHQGSETALLYYGLANDLIPASGYGHHQMGVIFLDEKKHFEIVYHFYRAWSAKDPHPNSSNNLEVEFRELLRPATAPRSNNAQDAFKSWFVRLHAFFYRGEAFPQHAELEQEVVHRFEMALKSHDMCETLMKMVLINICAYDIAQGKVNGKSQSLRSVRLLANEAESAKWTASGSHSCQFILQLNVRMILVLARLLKAELQDLTKRASIANMERQGETAEDPEGGPDILTPVIDAILPLFRVYVCWLGINRADIVRYAPHIQPHSDPMYRAVSQTLSSLLDVYGDSRLAAVPYLLPEDLDLLGIKLFDAPDLPAACQLLCKDSDGEKKPRADGPQQSTTDSQTVALGRVFDILKCGFFLAGDSGFPFTIVHEEQDGRMLTAIRYLDGSEPALSEVPGLDGSAQQRLPGVETSVEDLASKLSLNPGLAETEPGVSPRIRQQLRSSWGEFYPSMPEGDFGRVNVETSGGAVPPDTGLDSDFPSDQLFNVVSDFLAPPESKSNPQQASTLQNETSYGMHSSTANEVFGAVKAPSPTPNSGNKKSFPSLPWEYFYTPTPQQRSGQQWDVMTQNRAREGSGTLDLPNSMSSGSSVARIQGATKLDDPFAESSLTIDNDARRYNNLLASAPPGSTAAWEAAERYRLLGKGLVHHEEITKAYSGAFPDQSWQLQHPGPSWDNPGDLQHIPPPHGFPQGLVPDRQPVPPTEPTEPTQSTISFPVNSSFDRTAFSGNSSGLPPVNSPWGLPNAQQPASRTADVPSLPDSGSAGSLQSAGYPPGITHNGITYNATTAFGRGAVATKDDPSHFKNVVKTSGLAQLVADADEVSSRYTSSWSSKKFR